MACMTIRLFFPKWSHTSGWFSSVTLFSVHLQGFYSLCFKRPLPNSPEAFRPSLFLSDWKISRQIYSSCSWWDRLHPWPRSSACNCRPSGKLHPLFLTTILVNSPLLLYSFFFRSLIPALFLVSWVRLLEC